MKRGCIHTKLNNNTADVCSRMMCANQIFTLHLLLYHRFIHGQDTIAIFLDFVSKFDSIIRPILWKIMPEDVVPTRLVDLLKAYYEDTKSSIQVYDKLIEFLEVEYGVRQGFLASPILFNFIPKSVAELKYAHDVTLISESVANVREIIRIAAAMADIAGLTISTLKTKYLSTENDINSLIQLN
ncbi:hypothetical protein QYM36_016693 [Artemia franciscana]|uniref:Reverse transcriptase domain-containing protein n=1 Tax=Artemia franciscana TaxID=6661 RepID=A0AA88H447_ARTSF|nr:hypothetical protein QYM36_016693 [Artemia franciscana]